MPGDGSEDNWRFELLGDTLRTRLRLDERTPSELSIRVRSMDEHGNRVERSLRITVVHDGSIWTPGDTNRDGIFDSTDLILAFQAGEYEDNLLDNSVWADGDWNGDGEFDSSDIVYAFQRNVYVRDNILGAMAASDE